MIVGADDPALSSIPLGGMPAPVPVDSTRFADLLSARAVADGCEPDARPPVEMPLPSLRRDVPPSAAVAERFNETGFFAHAVSMMDEATTTAPHSPIGSDDPVATLSSRVPHFESDNRTLVESMPKVLTARCHEPLPPPPMTPLSTVSRGPVTRSGIALSRAGRPQSETLSLVQASPTVRHRPSAAAQSPVAIAVHEVAGGLSVVARIAGLDDAERARLSDEIAQLLARHGFATADIVIAGSATAARKQKDTA